MLGCPLPSPAELPGQGDLGTPRTLAPSGHTRPLHRADPSGEERGAHLPILTLQQKVHRAHGYTRLGTVRTFSQHQPWAPDWVTGRVQDRLDRAVASSRGGERMGVQDGALSSCASAAGVRGRTVAPGSHAEALTPGVAVPGGDQGQVRSRVGPDPTALASLQEEGATRGEPHRRTAA